MIWGGGGLYIYVECRYTHYTIHMTMQYETYTSGNWLFLDFDLFQRSTRANRSRHGQSFSKIDKTDSGMVDLFKDRKERKRIERSKDWIPNPEENRPSMEWFSKALLHTASWCGAGLRITAKRIRMIQLLSTSTDLMPAWAILFLVIMEAFQEEALATTFMHWYEVCHKKQYPGQLCQQKLRNISYILS